jgi:UDP:flavonoid glycosyltransferase YjiC (YdhE family)
MRIALIAEGTRGDIHPMLALGTSLMAAGHAVRVCASPDFADVALASGADFVPVGENVRAFLTGAAESLHGRGVGLVRQMTVWGERSLAHQFRVLPEATADVDYVLAAGTVFGAASMAELHGIPFRYVAYTPALLPSREHSPAMFPFQVRARWANGMLWRAAVTAMNTMVGRRLNAHRRGLGLPPLQDLISHVLSKRTIVAVDSPLAAMPADCPFAHDQIRCLHPFEPETLPADLERFLDAGPPPVHFGFGSMTDPDPATTTGRLLEAIGRLGCRALVERGWAGLGDGPLPEGVMAIDPVPHASLFPRLAAVVHHGGAGTTHTAARAGVPQIVVPHVLDQFYFARRVESLGIGPAPIPRASLNVRRLAAAVRDTLESQDLSARAADLAKRLADLGPVRPDVDRLLDPLPGQVPADAKNAARSSAAAWASRQPISTSRSVNVRSK